MITEDEIRTLISHAGAMCLLQRVESWNATSIYCSTESHLDPNNPLRSDDMLASLHGLEYGAQAMAIHGALLAGETGEARSAGYLAAARNMKLHVERLDRLTMPLQVRANRLFGDRENLIYTIEISVSEKLLMEARVGVMRRSEPTR